MRTANLVPILEAGPVFESWLRTLADAVERRDAMAFAALFVEGGYWRDMLSLTWEYSTFSGRAEIERAFAATIAGAGLKGIRIAEGRAAPIHVRRSGRHLVEGYFEFETGNGKGVGFVRLHYDDARPEEARVWQLMTSLYALNGSKDRVGENRPTGDKFSRIKSGRNWQQLREAERSYADRDPQVIVVGAGQSGLMVAARLRQMGVDVLVIERHARVGDNWRRRYNNLTLHNEIWANHFPYLEFPENWPVWLPKDMLADWLEAYAEFQELNVWTGTEITNAVFDDGSKLWTVTLRRPDGSQRVMHCPHLVAAMGLSGGVAKKPKLPGMSEFAGTVVHSSEFTSGVEWKGKRAIVVGTGNSGHDIAQDLQVCGAAAVSMVQRGPTCVVSLEPSATISYSVFAEGRTVEDADLMIAAMPYPVLIETYQWITKKTSALDKQLLTALEKAGFHTYQGEDNTGFQLLYLRGAGGYYINVGCSELIIEGKISVIQMTDSDRFVAEGLRLKDGSLVPADLVVLATGFETMQESIRRLLGNAIADKVGPVWGFDERCNMRNMWCRTAQDGLWIMGGAIVEARLFSRFLALQIKAALDGILPERSELPLARVR